MYLTERSYCWSCLAGAFRLPSDLPADLPKLAFLRP
jgi:hypothetical protein